MNTIIIHPGNRPKVSAAHDIAADLVSQGYRKLTPWWIDGSEQEGLLPLDEVDESAEEVGERFLEEKEEVDFAGKVVSHGYRKLMPWLVGGFEQKGLLPLDEVDESTEEVKEIFPEEKEEVDFAGEVDIFQDVDLLGGENALNKDESRAKQDIVFNLEAQVVNYVEDDNDGRVSTNKGNWETLDEVGKFVTFDPNSDDKGWDGDDEECNDSTDEEDGRDERRAIGSRHSSGHTGGDKCNEEESIHSIPAETRAMINKEWDEWFWGDVTDFHRQTDGPDQMAAIRGSFWNTEGIWTWPWESSDTEPSNDNTASRARDGLNYVEGLGLEGLDHLEFLNNLVVQAVNGTVDRHDLGHNIGSHLACARFGTQKQEMSTLRYGPRPMERFPEEDWMRGLGLLF